MKRILALCLASVFFIMALVGCRQANNSGCKREPQYTDDKDSLEELLKDNLKDYSDKYINVPIEYEPILDSYVDMVTKASNNEDVNSSDYDKLPIEVFNWLTQFVSQHNSHGKAYAIRDLNGDYKDELIILDGATISYRIYAVFTITEGNITPVITSAIQSDTVENIAIAQDGTIYKAVSLKCESYYHEVITLMRDGKSSVFAYSYEDYSDFYGYDCEVKRYKYLDGERTEITAEELLEIENEYADQFSNIDKLTANTCMKINYFFEYDPK